MFSGLNRDSVSDRLMQDKLSNSQYGANNKSGGDALKTSRLGF